MSVRSDIAAKVAAPIALLTPFIGGHQAQANQLEAQGVAPLQAAGHVVGAEAQLDLVPSRVVTFHGEATTEAQAQRRAKVADCLKRYFAPIFTDGNTPYSPKVVSSRKASISYDPRNMNAYVDAYDPSCADIEPEQTTIFRVSMSGKRIGAKRVATPDTDDGRPVTATLKTSKPMRTNRQIDFSLANHVEAEGVSVDQTTQLNSRPASKK